MSRPAKSPEDVQLEMADRLRRVETRLTRFMEWSGFDTEVRRPVWNDGVLAIPNDATSLRDCLACIPQTWFDKITLTHKGQIIATITRPRQ
jgi:hypothetical protein